MGDRLDPIREKQRDAAAASGRGDPCRAAELLVEAADEIEPIIAATRPETVLVTIPDAPRERLDAVVGACASAGVACRFVRRELDLDPEVVLGGVE